MTYRQHYLAGEVGGVTGALKYYLDAEASERLQNDPAVSDPLTASAALVAQYATLYQAYDATGRVTGAGFWAVVQSRLVMRTAIRVSTTGTSTGSRRSKRGADGSVRTHYTNFRNQVLLAEFKESATRRRRCWSSASTTAGEPDARGHAVGASWLLEQLLHHHADVPRRVARTRLDSCISPRITARPPPPAAAARWKA